MEINVSETVEVALGTLASVVTSSYLQLLPRRGSGLPATIPQEVYAIPALSASGKGLSKGQELLYVQTSTFGSTRASGRQ